jgi:hypothetical protein
VSQNRSERSPSQGLSTPIMMEVLRQGAEAGRLAELGGKLGKRMFAFGRILAAVVLLFLALLGVTTYQQFRRQVSEMRRDLAFVAADLRDELAGASAAQADIQRKDDMMRQLLTVWEVIRELRGDQTDQAALKERCAILAERCKTAEEDRKALAREVQRLRERRAGDGEKTALAREVQLLREQLAELEGRQSSAGPTEKRE